MWWMMFSLCVFEEKSSMIDVISVFGGYIDFAKASSLLDDGFIQNGIVECGDV